MNIEWIKKPYEEKPDSPSYAEVILFYISTICSLWFSLESWCGFQIEYLVLLFPAAYWIFLRASRKDMHATGNLIAGGMGAIGGALVVMMTKILK